MSRGPAINAGGLTMFSQLPTSSWTPGTLGQRRILLPVRDSGHKNSRGFLLPQDPPGGALTVTPSPALGPGTTLCPFVAYMPRPVVGSQGQEGAGLWQAL